MKTLHYVWIGVILVCLVINVFSLINTILTGRTWGYGNIYINILGIVACLIVLIGAFK